MRTPDDTVALYTMKNDSVGTVPDRKAVMVTDDDVEVRGPFDNLEAQRVRRGGRRSHGARSGADAQPDQGSGEDRSCDAAPPGHPGSRVSWNKRAA